MGTVGSSLIPIIILFVVIYTTAAIIIAKHYRSNQVVVMVTVLFTLILSGILLFGLPSATEEAGKPQASAGPQLTMITNVSPDPFTATPGASTNGIVTYTTNASAFVDHNTCLVKSPNTLWSTIQKKCQCKIGWFGNTCEERAYQNSYVALTTTSKASITYDHSFSTDALSLWPGTSDVSGCTDECSLRNDCLGVAYHEGVCAPITSATFFGPPIQDTSVASNSDTLYLNLSRLQQIKMSGYYNVIFGTLPPRYFVGNIISGLTGQNSYVTNTNSRILFFVINSDNTFVGIPDFIIVNSTGNLYISTAPLPKVITPGVVSGLLVSYTTPITITKEMFLTNFARSTGSTTFYIRYVQS